MMKKARVVIVLALFSIFFAFNFSYGANYPKPSGFVNDFANIIPADTKKKLESELREYERKTSIEIAVVTVKSLEGETVEDYTIGLAKSWGVGKKGKDNGIVLLVAPNERKMRIEVGYGLEPDMPDSAAGRIIKEGIIPFFKQGKMSDGVVVGVAELLKTLGNKPYQARLEERKAAEEKARIASEQSWESFKNIMWMMMIILTFGAAIFAATIVMRNILRKRRKLKTLHIKNGQMLADILKKIDEAEKEYPQTKEKLGILKSDNPKEIWSELGFSIFLIPAKIQEMRKFWRHCNELRNKGWRFSENVRGPVDALYKDANENLTYLELVISKIEEVKKAKKIGLELMRSLPEKIQDVEKNISHPDVSGGTRKIFAEAKTKYENTSKLTGQSQTNWLLAFGALSALSSLVDKVESAVESDKAMAEKARKEGPKLLKEIPGMFKKTQEKVSHKDVSEDTRKQLTAAKDKYEDAKRMANNSPVDWLIVFTALNLVVSWIHNAENQAVSEIDAVQRRRREKEESRRRRDSDSSSWSSSSSSSSSSGGSSFGGFGGGGFGGGGASGSW